MTVTAEDSLGSARQSLYDVIIIGGGIYGACMAWEAASRGLKTRLFEKGDFACATSANSMKIIHGGLRYLQKLDFSRCRQSSLERRNFLQIAPNLVSPLSCIMPSYGRLMKSKMALRVGMWMNDCLTFDRNKGLQADKTIPPGKVYNKAFCESVFNQFDLKSATGCAIWHDAQALNTERLVLSFIQSAEQIGAEIDNYHMVTKINDNGMVFFEDTINQESGQCQCKVLIDCSGPWENQFKKQYLPGEEVHYCKAINFVVDSEYSPHALGMKTQIPQSESRLLFFVPWQSQTLIGTWYFACDQDFQNRDPSEDEISLCVRDIQSLLPGFKQEQIKLIHTGFLPIRKGAEVVSQRLLDKAKIEKKRLANFSYVHVMGVKYTMARKVAESTLDSVKEEFPQIKVSSSAKQILHGNKRYRGKQPWGDDIMQRLELQYGENTKEIVAKTEGNAELIQLAEGSDVISRAELSYVIEKEKVKTLNDLLFRRLGVASSGPVNEKFLQYCLQKLAQTFAWSKQRQQQEVEAYNKVYLTSFKTS